MKCVIKSIQSMNAIKSIPYEQTLLKPVSDENPFIRFYRFFVLNAHQFLKEMQIGDVEGISQDILSKHANDTASGNIVF